jgi:hypothetical protein
VADLFTPAGGLQWRCATDAEVLAHPAVVRKLAKAETLARAVEGYEEPSSAPYACSWRDVLRALADYRKEVPRE